MDTTWCRGLCLSRSSKSDTKIVDTSIDISIKGIVRSVSHDQVLFQGIRWTPWSRTMLAEVTYDDEWKSTPDSPACGNAKRKVLTRGRPAHHNRVCWTRRVEFESVFGQKETDVRSKSRSLLQSTVAEFKSRYLGTPSHKRNLIHKHKHENQWTVAFRNAVLRRPDFYQMHVMTGTLTNPCSQSFWNPCCFPLSTEYPLTVKERSRRES